MIIKDILKSPTKIRIYFILLTLFLFFLIIINYYTLPELFRNYGNSYSGALPSFINNIIALFGSSLLASGFFWLITPSGMESSDVNVIASHDINSTLSSMLYKTERFYYYGHTARWNRIATFPKILEQANYSRSTKYIELIILDPENEDTCQFYASFGYGNRNKGRKIQSVRDVRIELLTTFLCCLENNKSPFISFDLYVTDKVSISRLDISDNSLLLTKPYHGDPALHFPKGTFFYNSYKEEFNIAKKQCKKINLNIRKREINKDNIHEILHDISLNGSYIDDDFIKDLLQTFKKIVKPY